MDLRYEAVACLALADLHPAQAWEAAGAEVHATKAVN
jgi:hypothetical protein